MRPSAKLVQFVGFMFVAAIVVFAWRALTLDQSRLYGVQDQGLVSQLLVSSWWLVAGGGAALIALDWLLSRGSYKVSVNRSLPQSLSLGVHSYVHLDIENQSSRRLYLYLTELHCSKLECSTLPLRLSVGARSDKPLRYAVYPIARGAANFSKTWLRIRSQWGFWFKSQFIDNPVQTKIYPNFAPIAKSTSVSLEHQIAQLGIHLLQRRGEGSDFHQLREFREGDAMRQIDWNATSRYFKPVSREYQDEKDQDVMFLLDCGRRLRGKEDELSIFDHALNAVLLTSYIALRQGDGVGLMSFGADRQRWLSPLKHPARIKTVMNQLYDLHSTTQASDYLAMAEEFLARRKKRALVVIVTSVREEDVDDFREAVRLLRSRHMVLVASLRDRHFDEKTDEPITNLGSALTHCAILDYLKRRSVLLTKIKSFGAIVSDSLPSKLHLDLVQEYLKLKRSGRF